MINTYEHNVLHFHSNKCRIRIPMFWSAFQCPRTQSQSDNCSMRNYRFETCAHSTVLSVWDNLPLFCLMYN